MNVKKIFKSASKFLPKQIFKKMPDKVEVVLVSPEVSRKLNYEYRKKNKATNVLSFRYDNSYGEIILCPEVIKKEAKKAGNPQLFQMTWMILHGMLHLSGINHEDSEKAAERFESLEERMLKKIFKINFG